MSKEIRDQFTKETEFYLRDNHEVYIEWLESELKTASELLKSAVTCANNSSEKGLCPQCKDSINEFLKKAKGE